MGNIIYAGSFALILLALGGVLSLVNINNFLTENNTNEDSIQTIDPNDDIKILNDEMIETGPGSYIIRGQAQNTGQYKIRYVSISVNFYDKNGHLLYSSFDAKSYINPGETWSFKVPYRKLTSPYFYRVKIGPTLIH